MEEPMISSHYHVFLDALNQLTQDQRVYESEFLLQDEFKGPKHEEIIKLGGVLCKRLRKFAEKGESFMDDLPAPDTLPKFTDSIRSYQNLIVPPKVFSGFCPCLKPARDGPEYDRKYLITKAKMVAAIFVSYAILILRKGDEIVSKCSHYDTYVDDMNKTFNTLSEIKCTNSEPKHLENVRRRLTVAYDQVENFLKLHGDRVNKPEFKTEAIRSLKKVQDLLTVKATNPSPSVNADGTTTAAGSVPIGRRILIKAQATMQEIMNSAAAISATEAKTQIELLENLLKTLKKSRESEVSQFTAMEEEMRQLSISEILTHLREESELIHSDCNSKLRDCTKRWTAIKNKSNQRKVAEYTEEGVSSFNPISSQHHPHSSGNLPALAGVPIKPIDPRKLARTTTEKFNEFGKKTKDVFDVAGNEMLMGLTNVGKTGAGVVKKVGHVFTGNETEQQQTVGTTAGEKRQAATMSPALGGGGLKMTNPFEGMTNVITGNNPNSSSSSGSSSYSKATTNKKEGFRFNNPLDPF